MSKYSVAMLGPILNLIPMSTMMFHYKMPTILLILAILMLITMIIPVLLVLHTVPTMSMIPTIVP